MGLLTIKNASAILPKKPSSIYDDIANGVYPAGVIVRLNRRIYFNEEKLNDWIERGGTLALAENTNVQSDESLEATA